MDGNYNRFELDNGLVVATYNLSTSETISAKLRVNMGAYHEDENQRGLAHFVEHCIFEGAENIPQEKADQMRKIFGYSNARTGLGRTGYEGSFCKEDLDAWLHFTSSLVFKPLFSLEAVEKHRRIILREIGDIRSTPNFKINKKIDEAFYRGHPKSQDIGGSEEIIRRATPEDLRALWAKGYHPNNCELLLSGRIPDNIRSLVESNFGDLKSGIDTRVKFPQLMPLERTVTLNECIPSMLNSDNPENSSAQVVLNFVFPPYEHPNRMHFGALYKAMGASDGSILSTRLREKEHLCYSVTSGYSGNYSAGIFNIHANIPASGVKRCVDMVFEEIEKIKKGEIGREHLDKIVRDLKFSHAKYSGTEDARISMMNTLLDYGLPPDYFVRAYEKLTPDDVMQAAIDYIPSKSGNYVLAVASPLI